MATNQTISTVLKTIKAAYPRFEVEAETVSVWASFVVDMDDELLLAAVARFISSADHAFPPSIPEIRAQATELRREIAGIPSAFEAWAELMDAPLPRPPGSVYRLFKDGKYVDDEEYVWPHDIVGVVARRLGWPARFPSGGNEVADRAHFVKAYHEEVSRRLQAETQIPLVTKFVEAEQSKRLIGVSREMGKLTSGMARR